MLDPKYILATPSPSASLWLLLMTPQQGVRPNATVTITFPNRALPISLLALDSTHPPTLLTSSPPSLYNLSQPSESHLYPLSSTCHHQLSFIKFTQQNHPSRYHGSIVLGPFTIVFYADRSSWDSVQLLIVWRLFFTPINCLTIVFYANQSSRVRGKLLVRVDGALSVAKYSTTFEEPSCSRPALPISSNPPGLLLSHPIEPTTSATSTTGSDCTLSPKPNSPKTCPNFPSVCPPVRRLLRELRPLPLLIPHRLPRRPSLAPLICIKPPQRVRPTTIGYLVTPFCH
ncbi:hypothetical protein PGTUg99_020655 [Puccinia graminis f. sp. tritici]|uniref:Uncharacterized protein n=1 Tax=Puccinia graminis f. sp. tritici TaxID=56615 RepID=A0A5B0SD62_PUCGR|nr:hypothetical protein PGTUg99_020655 [Puccinia graminis f. sp. tritici]